ncbi:MAG: polysaccharide deacetylase family protein [Acidimicrobiales bacterium]
MTSRLLLAGAGTGALAAGLLAGHALPALASWRSLRCWALPGLAGIGDPNHVALTFDDGPDPMSTPAFLDALDELGWKATFFLLGSMVRRAPALTAEIAARGHEIGVHGDEHLSHLHLTPAAIRADLARALDSIYDSTSAGSGSTGSGSASGSASGSGVGVSPIWFRPPYGALSAGSLTSARRLGLRTVLWTTWGRDWRSCATPATVAADVVGGLLPGATVLLHDSDCTSAPESWRATLGALPMLAAAFEERGLKVGPLGDHGLHKA